jgi:hypothetical protein
VADFAGALAADELQLAVGRCSSALFFVTDVWAPTVGALVRAGSSHGLGRPSGPRVNGPA